jgi:hypothetical protein
MGKRRTETSGQGLRSRMTDHFNEPASRATRWALFVLRRKGSRRELARPLSFAIPKERKQIMGRRPRRPRIPTARSTNPFDRAGRPSQHLQMLSVFFFVARGIFAFCLCACATGLERKRGKSARGKSLLLLCVVRAHSSA